jgi:hypothetical protein
MQCFFFLLRLRVDMHIDTGRDAMLILDTDRCAMFGHKKSRGNIDTGENNNRYTCWRAQK